MIEFSPAAMPTNINAETMKTKDHPKSNTLLARGSSGILRSSVMHSGFQPASKALICLGWLRLYQTILLNRSRTRHAIPR
jgi:hypothetical protein